MKPNLFSEHVGSFDLFFFFFLWLFLRRKVLILLIERYTIIHGPEI